jgi:protease I
MISLKDIVVAILVEDGFEHVELTEPREALDQDGATTLVVSPRHKFVRAWNFTDWGDRLPVDRNLDEVQVGDFDALLLPGGVMNPDALRLQPKAVRLVRAFFEAGKPVASICHGPWTLIEADVVRKRKVTSWPSLKTDLRNAGAEWVDREVVTDDNLVTSRRPADIPAFNLEMIDLFRRVSKSSGARQRVSGA